MECERTFAPQCMYLYMRIRIIYVDTGIIRIEKTIKRVFQSTSIQATGSVLFHNIEIFYIVELNFAIEELWTISL